jgi:hypothetical protein
VWVKGTTDTAHAGIDMAQRVEKANALTAKAMGLLRPGWNKPGSGMVPKLARDLVAAAIVPTLVFGSQTGAITKATLEQMKKSLGRAMRACMGTFPVAPNTALRIDLGIHSIEAELARGRLSMVRWFAQHPVEMYRRLMKAMLTTKLGEKSQWRSQVEADMESLKLAMHEVTNEHTTSAEWKAMLRRKLIVYDTEQASEHVRLKHYPVGRLTRKIAVDGELVDSPYEVEVRKVARGGPEDGTYEQWRLRPQPYITVGRHLAHHGYVFRTGFNHVDARGRVGSCHICKRDDSQDSPQHIWECPALPQELRDEVSKVGDGLGFDRVVDFAEARRGEGGKEPNSDKTAAKLALMRRLRELRSTSKNGK